MYPAGYDPSAVVAQAQSYAPQAPAQFPQMTPGSSPYYGPTHAALSKAFQAALLQQMAGNGLLSQVTPQQMGLLSTAMPSATAVPMPATGGGNLGPNQYYRLTPDFWNSVYQAPQPAAATTNASGGLFGYDPMSGNRHGNGSDPYRADTSRDHPDNPNAIGNNIGSYSLGLSY